MRSVQQSRLKASFRRIASRYEKTSRNSISMIKLASVRLLIGNPPEN